ncbi:hypothetical protein TTHERM_000658799 (macronuclear) [Tetrahymena thermophila SB210]|uniref:Uncharacterized protein n=1 Tax=Tetrahymena thermophila (strain SB210) TaxID=312017 RepID=W7X3J2_TETTS|nr:hypothetical protein TTHERM_000658799 [Tetrahymena thermophila SB210]EWS72032.1 hypothetical protein TTHERM_000658799 [Tetrahymena thermophila SB210]|eukprot:XP_012655439.1 hypothetical protein TTHERM_000658799 [Tetrahymena thermophila SB210]
MITYSNNHLRYQKIQIQAKCTNLKFKMSRVTVKEKIVLIKVYQTQTMLITQIKRNKIQRFQNLIIHYSNSLQFLTKIQRMRREKKQQIKQIRIKKIIRNLIINLIKSNIIIKSNIKTKKILN